MHTNEPRPDPLVDLGYEPKDVDFRKVGKASWWFFGFVFFSLGAAALFMWRFVPKHGTADYRPIPAAPNPLLQSNITVRTDTMKLRKNEEMVLTTAGRNKDGTYHIPIESAIDLIARRGIQKTSAPPMGRQPRPQVPDRPSNTTTTPGVGPRPAVDRPGGETGGG